MDDTEPVGSGANCAGPAQTAELSAWVAGGRAGDEAAARALVERPYPVIAPVIHANRPRRGEPEELMPEGFLKMFSRLEQSRGEAAFERRVARIALNTCLERLCRQRVRPELRWANLTPISTTRIQDRTQMGTSLSELKICVPP